MKFNYQNPHIRDISYLVVYSLFIVIIGYGCYLVASYYSKGPVIHKFNLIIKENFFVKYDSTSHLDEFSSISKSISFDSENIIMDIRVRFASNKKLYTHKTPELFFCFSTRIQTSESTKSIYLEPDLVYSKAYSYTNDLTEFYDKEKICYRDSLEKKSHDYYYIRLKYFIDKLKDRELISITYYCADKCEDLEIYIPDDYSITFAPGDTQKKYNKVVFTEKEKSKHDPSARRPTPDFDVEILMERPLFINQWKFSIIFGGLLFFFGTLSQIFNSYRLKNYKKNFKEEIEKSKIGKKIKINYLFEFIVGIIIIILGALIFKKSIGKK